MRAVLHLTREDVAARIAGGTGTTLVASLRAAIVELDRLARTAPVPANVGANG